MTWPVCAPLNWHKILIHAVRCVLYGRYLIISPPPPLNVSNNVCKPTPMHIECLSHILKHSQFHDYWAATVKGVQWLFAASRAASIRGVRLARGFASRRNGWRSNSEAPDRLSTSTSKHLSKKSWNTGDNLCLSLMSGLPFVAIKYSAWNGQKEIRFRQKPKQTLGSVFFYANSNKADFINRFMQREMCMYTTCIQKQADDLLVQI